MFKVGDIVRARRDSGQTWAYFGSQELKITKVLIKKDPAWTRYYFKYKKNGKTFTDYHFAGFLELVRPAASEFKLVVGTTFADVDEAATVAAAIAAQLKVAVEVIRV